ALFEVAYQFATAGAGVAGAAAMLHTAPLIVAILARWVLKEALTPVRLLLSLLVMAGVALTVTGGSNAGAEAARLGLGAGIAGGLLSAVSYALTTLMARFAVPRYGAVRVLFLEAIGGVVILGIVLTLAGRAPTPPPSLAAWRGLVALTAGSVLAANLFFFSAVKRIEAAPAAVAPSAGGRHVAAPAAHPPNAERDARGGGHAGTAILAAARRLHDPGHAGHRDAHDRRLGDPALRQQLPRHVALPLAAAGPEHLQSEQPWRLPEPDRRPARGPGVRGRLDHPIRP